MGWKFWENIRWKFWEKETEIPADEESLQPGTYNFLYDEIEISDAIKTFFNKEEYVGGKNIKVESVYNEGGFTKVRVTIPNPVPLIVYAVAVTITSIFAYLGLRVTFKGVEKVSKSPIGIAFGLGMILLIFPQIAKAFRS